MKFLLKNTLFISCLNRCNKNICVSESLKTSLVSHGVHKEKIEVIHNAPSDRFLETDITIPLQQCFHIVMVARLETMKGQQDLIEACKDFTNTKITFVGWEDSSISENILLQIADYDLEVEFKGHVEDIRTELISADVVVLPSYTEGGCPLALQEGMAMKRPIVATNIPSIQELVRDQIDGLLVPPGDVYKLRKAILELKSSPEIRKKMGENAKTRILESFSQEKWKQKTLEFFKKVHSIPDHLYDNSSS